MTGIASRTIKSDAGKRSAQVETHDGNTRRYGTDVSQEGRGGTCSSTPDFDISVVHPTSDSAVRSRLTAFKSSQPSLRPSVSEPSVRTREWSVRGVRFLSAGVSGASRESTMSAEQQKDSQTTSLQKLKSKVEGLAELVWQFEETVEKHTTRLNRHDEELESLRNEMSRLEGEVDRLDSRTDMLEMVEQADEMDGKQRSVTLIQHLVRAAESKRRNGKSAKASVNRDQAEEALHYPDVHRTTIYTDMERAKNLVGDEDVLTYESADDGSFLKLNLEEGDLPGHIDGHEIHSGTRGCGSSTTEQHGAGGAENDQTAEKSQTH